VVEFGTPERGKSKAKAARGRLCAYTGCTTVLSIYNPSSTCWPHTQAPLRHPLHRG
jgi:hypothetical protein